MVNTSGANTNSNQHYCSALAYTQNNLPLDQWTEFSGYVKGSATTGVGGLGTIASPAKMHANVRKIAPLIICNLGGGTTTIYVDQFRIEEVNTDAAAIINAGSTKINPGQITISGPTPLDSLLGTTDQTKINGGKIETGSITAGMGVFYGPLQSDGFVAGTSGWQINKNGNSEFGWSFLRLQDRLRQQWRTRFYRFVPEDDYVAMVVNPARSAARAYNLVGMIAILVALVVTAAAVLNWFSSDENTNLLTGAIEGVDVVPPMLLDSGAQTDFPVEDSGAAAKENEHGADQSKVNAP